MRNSDGMSRHLLVLMTALLTMATLPGCASFSQFFGTAPDASVQTALSHLQSNSRITAKVVTERNALVSELTDSLMAIEKARVRGSILRDLDAWLSADGQSANTDGFADALTDSGNRNALVEEVRNGRMTMDQVKQLVRDFAAGQGLSDQQRSVVEDGIVEQFQAMRDLEARQTALGSQIQTMAANDVLLAQDTDQWLGVFAKMAGGGESAYSMVGNRALFTDVLTQTAQVTIHDDALRQSVIDLIQAVSQPNDQSNQSTN